MEAYVSVVSDTVNSEIYLRIQVQLSSKHSVYESGPQERPHLETVIIEKLFKIICLCEITK